MKKYLFLCLVTFLFILFLIYFYDKRNVIINKIWKDENIYIEYPSFNKKNIDNYIEKYISNIINNSDYKYKYKVSYYLYDNSRLIINVNKYFDDMYSYYNNCFNVDIHYDEIEKISCNN